ncbi:MAG: exosortase V [Caulobacteraceae bacterium]
MEIAASRRFRSLRLADGWWLAAPFALLAIPTMVDLARQDWSRDFGAYGPIVLATGAWLLWRETHELRAGTARGSAWLTWPVLGLSFVLYVFGRAFDFLTLETAGVYGVGLAMLNSKVGARAMLRCWFPLLYLAFVIPIPSSILADVTAPLKEFVSYVATGLLSHVGLPVVRQGVTIYIAQYQLLVEDACSGMNSIVGLIAVGLLYIYLMRGASLAYSLVLVALVIPIAVLTNILRIMTLILLTYYAGNDVAQGFLHFTAGMALFAVALVIVFALDSLLHPLFRKRAA